MKLVKTEDTRRGGGGREKPVELLEKLNGGGGGGEGGLHWAGLPQLPAHRSQWKFIFLIRHISFRIRLDSMLKIIRNYINPNRLTVRIRNP
jgi:hypothetical protein